MVGVIILGFLLMAGAGTATGLLIADNRSSMAIYTPHLAGHTLPSTSAVVIFGAGVALAILFCLGAWAAVGGMVRRRRSGRSYDPVDGFVPGRWSVPDRR
jgi:hypothetical protein